MQIVVLGKSGCGLCRAALDKLERLGLPHLYVPLDSPARALWREPDGAGGVWEAPADWRGAGVEALSGVGLGNATTATPAAPPDPDRIDDLERKLDETAAAVEAVPKGGLK